MSDTNTAPGWYPDAHGRPGHQRWWDGTQWTQHVQAPEAPPARQVPQAREPFPALRPAEPNAWKTLWIWLVLVLPLVSLLPVFAIDWGDVLTRGADLKGVRLETLISSGAVFDLVVSSGYLVWILICWLAYVLAIVFAAADRRELARRGVRHPFHWAFMLIAPAIYLLGRSVVVERQTGRGSVLIWLTVVTMVVTGAVSVHFLTVLFAAAFNAGLLVRG